MKPDTRSSRACPPATPPSIQPPQANVASAALSVMPARRRCVRRSARVARASRAPPATTLTKEQVEDIVRRGPPTNIGTPEDPPREPNTAICNESVLEGVMSVARQQSDRATKMYEDERKRREEQDVQLSTANSKVESLTEEVASLKAQLEKK